MLQHAFSYFVTGKTNTANFLANHYQAAYLTIDSIINEALTNGTSPVCLRAQEMHAKATLDQIEKENEDGNIYDCFDTFILLTICASISNIPSPHVSKQAGSSLACFLRLKHIHP